MACRLLFNECQMPSPREQVWRLNALNIAVRPCLRSVLYVALLSRALLWMVEILHHLETMGNHCSLVFTRDSSFWGFLGGAGFRPSTVSLPDPEADSSLNGLPATVEAPGSLADSAGPFGDSRENAQSPPTRRNVEDCDLAVQRA